MPSLRVRLLRWLIWPILLVNLAGGALTYALAWLPARQAFDDSLLDTATILAARPLHGGSAPAAHDIDALSFAVRDGAGHVIAGDAGVTTPPSALNQPFDTMLRGEAVRMVVVPAATGQGATVTVAKTLRKRNQAREAIVRALILLEGVVTLASSGLIWYSVTSGLRPLQQLRAALKARAADDLSPVPPGDMPDELEPVVRALNGLLDKAGENARARQDFLANMAHQLRTPLAGLHAQLDVLGQRDDPDAARALALMRASSERMIRQVNQLLALARAEPGQGGKARLEALALDTLLTDTIQHFVTQAGARDMDIGFELLPTRVRGDRFLLRDLVDNLVDNAIRYTPPGGSVTVACRPDGDGAVLTVEDTGPGIAPGQRAAVFSRFVRLDEQTTGSGLGLAIVRDIAAAHGAAVSIDSPSAGTGARFTVRFPP